MNAEYTGKKIAELRKEKNMTQKELAAALDSTPSILLGLEEASKEEIVNSFAEISNQQSEEALKDIQQVGWIICRKLDAQKEKLSSSLKPFAVVFATALLLVCLLGQDLIAKTYVMVFHEHLESYVEKLLDKAEESGDILHDTYGFWEVACYTEDEMVEFSVGGKGLVFNSTYWGFYYSQDNTHKVFLGADIPLNINKDMADWYGEGDNWGKSIRLRDKWFWYEASF